MSARVPVLPSHSIADIEHLVAKHAALRQQEHKTPAQLLRGFQEDIDNVVLPFIVFLTNYRNRVHEKLVAFAHSAISADMKASSSIDPEREMRIAEQVDTEMNYLHRELEDLPANAPRRGEILRALGLRQTELDMLIRKLNVSGDNVQASMDKMNAHIRALEQVQSGVLAHRKTTTLGESRGLRTSKRTNPGH